MPSSADVQALEAPLNDKARTALQDLTRKSDSDRSYNEKLRQAAELITEITGKINDRGYELKQRHDKKLKRLAEKQEEEDEDDKKEFDDFQNPVAELTEKMDHSMRKTIDNRIWAQELPGSLRHVSDRAMNAPTQATQAQDNEDGNNDTLGTECVAPEDTPSALLHAALTTNTTRWTSKTLTERYAHDNDYASFYKTLWDARHPSENAPPLPAPALWFAREENPSTALSQPHASQPDSHSNDPDDDDLAVASERVSLKCPITLRFFSDPVTSDICNHTFDRTAILDMLKTSNDTEPFSPAQQAELSHLPRAERQRAENHMRVKRVRCPDSGCRQYITESSLRPNPVLLRKVNREIEAQRRRNAESDDDEDEDEDELQGPGGTQRKPFGLDGIDSSPPPESKRSGRVKSERMSGRGVSARRSVVPQTQLSSPPSGTQRTTAEGATVMELDDDDDE